MLKLSDLDKPDRYALYRDAAIEKVKEHRLSRLVHLGPFLAVSFESLTTIRHLVQERIFHHDTTDISEMQHEIELASPLIPQVGSLTATLYVDITTETEVKEWFPKLQGVEHNVHIEFPDGALLQALVEPSRAAVSTVRKSKSPSRNIVWHLSPQQRMLFSEGTPSIVVIHPGYSYRAPLAPNLHADLFREVSGTST